MRLATLPEHWRCRVCENREAHMHEYQRADGTRYFEDHSYDVRDAAFEPFNEGKPDDR
jgi:hypothetical protein